MAAGSVSTCLNPTSFFGYMDLQSADHVLDVNEEVPHEGALEQQPGYVRAKGSEDNIESGVGDVNKNSSADMTTLFTLFPQDRSEKLAKAMSDMRPTRPEIVRSVRAFQALQNFGAAFRGIEHDFFSMSKPAHKMQFWSHSWHGSTSAKVITLYFIQNASPAAVLSTILAFCVTMFFYVSQIPSLDHMVSTLSERAVPCCFAIALVTYGQGFLLWRRQEAVFVDKLCIDDSDRKLKAEGLLSIGAILKSSDSMLVLWDKTYQKRF